MAGTITQWLHSLLGNGSFPNHNQTGGHCGEKYRRRVGLFPTCFIRGSGREWQARTFRKTADISYCTGAASLAKTLGIQSGGSAPLCAEMIGTWNRMASIQQAWLSYVKSIFRSTFKQSLRIVIPLPLCINHILWSGKWSDAKSRLCYTKHKMEFNKTNSANWYIPLHIKIGFVEIFQHRIPSL